MGFSSTNTLFGPDGKPIQQPKPPTTPATGSAPITPAPGSGQAATDWAGDFNSARTVSDQLLEGKEPKHVVDEHAGRNEEYLNLLQSRLGGLDSNEMRAAKEEGLAGLGQQTAQSLERYGSLAGANGVQGGARAGLMGRALAEGDRTRASLERNLILDNIAAKDKAMNAYGAGLGTVTDRALGVTRENTGMDNAFTGLQLDMPFQIMGGIGGYQARNDARDANDRVTDIAQGVVDGLPGGTGAATGTTQAGAPAGVNPPAEPGGPRTGGPIDKFTTDLNDLGAQVGSIMSGSNPGDRKADINAMVRKAEDLFAQQLQAQYPEFEGLNGSNYQHADDKEVGNRFRDLYQQMLREWKWNAGLTRRDGSLRY